MSNKLTRSDKGGTLFIFSIGLGAIALELLHRSAPRALGFAGDYRAVFVLAAISLLLFVVAVIVFRPEPFNDDDINTDSFYGLGPVEMRDSWSAPGSHDLGDDAFSGHFVKRDGKHIPIVFYASHDDDGGYRVRDEATLLVTTRIAGCAFPKDSVIHLTRAEVENFQNGSEVNDAQTAYNEGDSDLRAERNERR